MKKQKLKQYLREVGCSIESHSQGETFQEVGNFILGKWKNTTFVVEAVADGIILRVKREAEWSVSAAPCRACSRFMGLEVPSEVVTHDWAYPTERKFVWQTRSTEPQE